MTTLHQLAKNGRQRRKQKDKRLQLQRCPQRKGTCTRVGTMTPKKPCSARRAFCRVKLTNKIMVTCHIPGEQHNLKKFSTVLVRGGRTNDLPGVHYKVIRGAKKTDLYPVYRRQSARSKYGVKDPT